MSNWDIGFGREPADNSEPRYPSQPGGPGGAPSPPGDTAWHDDPRWFGAADYPGDDADPDDPQDAPYPLTFERDDFDGAGSRSAASWVEAPPPPPPPPTPPPPSQPWPAAADPFELFDGDPYVRRADTTRAPNLDAQAGEEPWLADLRGPRWEPEARSGRPRLLFPAVVAAVGAVIGVTLVLLTSGHPSAPAASGTAKPRMLATATAGHPATSHPATSHPAASHPATSRTPAPKKTAAAAAPLTLATAEAALADYTSVNNSANAQRSNTELAMVETGGSDAIDAGVYTVGRADGAAPYPAFAPTTATYYLPQAEPVGGPRWFVVRVANAFAANPKKVTSTEYLLFTQAAPGGPWRNAMEPYLLSGADAPQIAIGGDGLATAVSDTATSLAAAPGQLAALTAATLDDTSSAVSFPTAGGLADRSALKFWQAKLPTATVTDTDAAATGPEGQTFALLTTNGGALVFYTDSADLTITAPTGSGLRLTVPGFYSAAQALPSAGLAYLDQFAAYDPPPTAGVPSVIGEYSGPTGKN
jgi:hypothetical protein